jgi:transcription termination/antitermination protein NusA
VLVDDDAKQATVIVPDDQLSLAIGREGQNARLAARLTGWRVDIRSETEFAAEEAEHGYEEEEVQGRCAAILSNGRRCPNASLPGSRYCGLESHQALAAIDSDKIADLAPSAAGADTPAAQGPESDSVAQEPVADGVAQETVAHEPTAGSVGATEPVAEDAAAEPSEQAIDGAAPEPLASDEIAASHAPAETHAPGAQGEQAPLPAAHEAAGGQAT